MSKKLNGTVSDPNFTFVKVEIGFENWDRILNEFVNGLREQKEHKNGSKKQY